MKITVLFITLVANNRKALGCLVISHPEFRSGLSPTIRACQSFVSKQLHLPYCLPCLPLRGRTRTRSSPQRKNFPSMTTVEWYWMNSSQNTFGPLTADQLKELVKGSVINRETLIWSEMLEDWVPASTVPEFGKLFVSTKGTAAFSEAVHCSDEAAECKPPSPIKAPKTEPEYDSIVADWLSEELANPEADKRKKSSFPTTPLSPTTNRNEHAKLETKTCPMCAESVQKNARICRFCQHDFTNSTSPKSARPVVQQTGDGAMFSFLNFTTVFVIVLAVMFVRFVLWTGEDRLVDVVAENSLQPQSSTVTAPAAEGSTVTVPAAAAASSPSYAFRKELFTECHRKAALLAQNPGGSALELKVELSLVEAAIKSEQERRVFRMFEVIHNLSLDFALQERQAQQSKAIFESYQENGKFLEAGISSLSEDVKNSLVVSREIASFRERGFEVFLPYAAQSEPFVEKFTSYGMDRMDGKHAVYFRSGSQTIHDLIREGLKQAGGAINGFTVGN